MKVMKFGAVSVSEVAWLRSMVRIIKAICEQGEPLVVVCTALVGIIDTLTDAARSAAAGDTVAVDAARRELWRRHRTLAEKLVSDSWGRETLYREWAELLKTLDQIARAMMRLGEHPPRSIDAIASLGERFGVHLVVAVLRQNGIPAQIIDVTALIVTNDHFGAAHAFLDESVERIRLRLKPLLLAGIVPVVPGNIGATREGVVSILGRGGSNYTAALIGTAMAVQEVCLWTDVDGILTADPKIVPEARTLVELSYVEAAEIASFGIEMTHPHMLTLLAEQGIPLSIRNIWCPDRPGTRIVANPQAPEQKIQAIISTHGLSLLSVAAATTNGHDRKSELPVRALTCIAEASIEIYAFSQSFSEHSLTLAMRSADAIYVRDRLTASFEHDHPTGAIPRIALTMSVALVTVISTSGGNGFMPQTLTALGRAGVHILALSQATSSQHISFLLSECEVDRAVRVLHRELGLAC